MLKKKFQEMIFAKKNYVLHNLRNLLFRVLKISDLLEMS